MLNGAVDALGDARRLTALQRTELLDTPAEEAFDRLTRLAVEVVPAPVSLISLITTDRQFFKSAIGLPEPWAVARETPLTYSFCQHVVRSGQPLVVSDARNHPLLQDNLAVKDLNVLSYAGVPLVTTDQQVLGSFAVLDLKVREWTDRDMRLLGTLGACAASEIALREAGRHFRQAADHNHRLAREVQHRVGNNLAALTGMVCLVEQTAADLPSFATAIRGRLEAMSHVHRLLGQGGYADIDLRRLVSSLLDVMGYGDGTKCEVALDGPAVTIPSTKVLALAMVLVEWITNSGKYGACASTTGRLAVHWEINSGGAGNRLKLHWLERGGPAIQSPVVASLGMQLVEGFVTRELRGRCWLQYPSEGADLTIEFGV